MVAACPPDLLRVCPYEIEMAFRIWALIHEFSCLCCSLSSGGVMLVHKRKVGLLAIDIEGGRNIQKESQNRSTELEGGTIG